MTTIATLWQDSEPTIGQLNDLTESMSWIAQLAGIAIVIFAMFLAVTRFLKGEWGQGLVALAVGACGAAIPFVVPILLDDPALQGGTEPTASPTATPTPETTPAPDATPAEPADFTFGFVLLGVILGLILLTLLVWLLVTLSRKARTSIQRSRRQQAIRAAATQRVAAAWQSIHDRHNELLRKILHSETDWDSLFYTPALTDPNVPQTYAMLRAMQSANTLRDTDGKLPSGIDLTTDLTQLPYAKAVEDFAHAWDVAERNARRLGQKGIPAAERKLIKEIRTLLDMAENGAASESERNLAYRRAQSLIEKLESVYVPPQAIAQLEERHTLMLTEAAHR